jgi:hypothetical protein
MEALLLSIANRKASLIWDIYLKSQIDAVAEIKTIIRLRKNAMQARKISFATFFSVFTLMPQKLRLLFSSGLPRT